MKYVKTFLCAVVLGAIAVPMVGWSTTNASIYTTLAPTGDVLEARLLGVMPTETDVLIMLRDGESFTKRLKTIANSQAASDGEWLSKLTANPEFAQIKMMLFGISAAANTNAWSAVGSLLGDRLAIGIDFDEEGNPSFVVASGSSSPAIRNRVVEQAMTLVMGANSANLKPNQIVPLGEVFFTYTDDGLMVFSNKRNLMTHRAKNSNTTLLSLVASDVPADALIWMQVSDDLINSTMQLEGESTEKANEPLLGFMFGDWLHALHHANDGLMWLEIDDDSIQLSTKTDSNEPVPSTHQGLISTFQSNTPIWSGQTLNGYTGQLLLSRNWADLFSEREAILNTVAAGQAVDFTSTLTTLMSGLDVMDDLLPAINGPINVIVAKQNFTSLGFTPNPQLPAFALMTPLDLSATKNMAQRLRSGVLSALSIIALEMTNANEPAYAISMDNYKNVQIVLSTYLLGDDDETDMSMMGPRFNFAPCAAIVDEYFIITTSIDLMKDLIDQSALGPKQLQAPLAANGLLHIDSSAVLAILEDNKDAMIADNMLKNNSRTEATRNIDLILSLVDLVKDVTITSTPNKNGDVLATLTMNFEEGLLATQ